jgi:YidC/Oxa1 family membrane protein insertase
MNIRKIVLYCAVAVVGIFLYQAWLKDYGNQPAPVAAATPAQNVSPEAYAPSDQEKAVAPAASAPSPVSAEDNGKIITVNTDALQVGINLKGGNVVSVKLPKYPEKQSVPNVPIQILNPNPDQIYVAQTGLTNVKGPITFTTEKDNYDLALGEKSLTIKLVGKTSNGLEITKAYTFDSNSYAIELKTTVKNNSGSNWSGSLFNQITRKNLPVETSFHSRSYDSTSYFMPDKPYTQLPYKEMLKQDLNVTVPGGWVAMQQKYFLSAWVPSQDQSNRYYSHVLGKSGDNADNKIFILGYMMPTMTLANGAESSTNSKLYVGPEVAKNLKVLAPGLDATIDYGWLYPISKIIFAMMSFIHKIVGNWGWSIVLVTLLIKVMFYWFSDKSYKSMAKMRAAQPKIEALKARYPDDKAAQSKAMMEFYRKEKINPMGGCLPMLIQIPVFIALYYVLIESVELRQAPWILWIHDLSVRDPYSVLPILMGLSMLLQTAISPKSPDPMQAKLMYLMPVIFTVVFWSFPAGLVLYWLTNNILSISQQWYVMKTYNPAAEKKKKKK